MDVRYVLTRVRWILVLAPLIWVLTAAHYWSDTHELIDVWAYIEAGESVRENGTAYAELPVPGPHRIGLGRWYIYPPPFAAGFSTLPESPAMALRFMIVAGITGAALASWALPKLARLSGIWWPLAVGGVLFASPLPWAVVSGSAHPPLLGLTFLALVSSPALAAFLLAVCASVVVNPVWPLGVVLWRAPRAWMGAALGVGVVTLLSLAALGPAGFLSDCLTWLTHVAPTLAQGQYDHFDLLGSDVWFLDALAGGGNLSPSFAVVDLLTDAPPLGEPIPLWARIWLTAVQVSAPLVVAYVARGQEWRVQAGVVLVAATLAAPIVRANYLVILLILPALLWRTRTERSTRTSAERERAHAAVAERITQL